MAESLMGTYPHTIDPKGRMNFPVKLKNLLGPVFIVTKGLDRCLFVYSKDEWAKLEERINTLPLSKGRDLQRFFFSGACEVETDKQGRILIPPHLREYASLEKDTMVIGASNRAEIWSKERWEEQSQAVTPELLETAMESLGF